MFCQYPQPYFIALKPQHPPFLQPVQNLLVAEGNSKYVLAESVREKLSNQEAKKADASKAPYLYRTSTIPVSNKSFRYFMK